MGDRAYTPSPKPISNPQPRPLKGGGGGGGATANGVASKPLAQPPASLAQHYGYARPPYRPKPPPPRSRSRRGFCCACCLWLTLLLIGLVFLAAIAAGVFYVLYRPQRPSFTVTSLRLAALNLTDSDLLTSRLQFAVTARNPNEKIAFVYGDISVSAAAAGVGIGEETVPGFVHGAGNTTVIKVSIASSGQSLDPVEAADLRELRSYPMEVDIETKAGVKIGGFKTKRIGITASCRGISAAVAKKTVAASPSSSSSSSASSVDSKCKPRIKIWIWTS